MIRVRIGHQYPMLVLEGDEIGTALRMRPQNPQYRVTAGVTRNDKDSSLLSIGLNIAALHEGLHTSEIVSSGTSNNKQKSNITSSLHHYTLVKTTEVYYLRLSCSFLTFTFHNNSEDLFLVLTGFEHCGIFVLSSKSSENFEFWAKNM